MAACGGDDTTGGAGGSTGTGGAAAGTGGATNTGGSTATGGGTATGGATGTGGTLTDASVSDACTCTGATCTPAGVLFNFDSGDAGDAASWDFFPTTLTDGGAPTKGTSATEGHTAAGSLTYTVPYTDFGQMAVSLQHNYGSSPTTGALNWSCKTAIHIWVKVAGADGDAGSIVPYLNGIQAYIQSGDPTSDASNMGGYAFYTSSFTSASTFADGAFHEIVVPLTPTTGTPANPLDINQIGVQVLPLTAAPDGGGVTPGPVTLFIDDISLQ
jgi:hypothetical protein